MKKTLACAAFLTVAFSANCVLAVELSIEEKIGKHLYQDKDLSLLHTQSCATCHHRSAGFADPTNARDPEGTMVSLGDDGVSVGDRNAPTAAYAGYSPILYYDTESEGWIGGMFWDGRMTGEVLGDPLAEQAQGPPLNKVEMNMPSVESVIERVSDSNYAHLFIENYSPDFFDQPAQDVYDEIARLIAAYERSPEVNPFNSPYDKNELSKAQTRGFDAFVKAECHACHSLTIPIDSEDVPAPGPVFTSYGYANIGVPTNYAVRVEPDLGLGYVVEGEEGKFKIPTLRNVAETAPYSHNGYFPTLEEMVLFHVNRGNFPPDVEKNLVNPLPDYVELSSEEIADIVTFLGALTDNGKTRNGR